MESKTIELLRELVSIDSRTGNENRILEFIEDKLIDSDFRVSRQKVSVSEKPRYNLLAKKGSGDFAVMFFAHVDTVSPDAEYEKQGINPLELRFDDENKVYRGLGCADQKAGVAALISAFTDYMPDNIVIKLAFLVDEEADSLGAYKLIQERPDFLEDVAMLISTDLGGADFDTRADVPGVSYYAGNYGRFPLRLSINGERIHGSIAGNTQPALEASRLLLNLWENQTRLFKPNAAFDSPSISVRNINSTSVGFSSSERIDIDFDFSVGTDVTGDSMLADLRLLMMNLRQEGKLLLPNSHYMIEIPDRGIPYFGAFIADSDNEHIARTLECYQDFFKQPAGNCINRSVADSNAFATLIPEIPVITLGPTGGNAHNFNEWLHKDAADSATAFYRFLIESCEKK
ncbi:MAG: M20/M25/M40 family metallo-hydrolase [Planctomycetes bacterium]|nr:M20/M25/M40 family metallo-hydrolase [Planctomycetota bacterium]